MLHSAAHEVPWWAHAQVGGRTSKEEAPTRARGSIDCASAKMLAFIRFRSSPSQENEAKNSSFKRSLRGSDHKQDLVAGANALLRGMWAKAALGRHQRG